jgi:hypothetical protein
VLVTAIALEIALRRRPVDRILADVFQAEPRRLCPAEIPPATIERAIRLAYRVLPLERTCLKHALILGRVRRAQGLPAELRIGVQKTGSVFGAHAWVEDGLGNVLTDPLDGFRPMPLPRDSFRDGRAID